MICGLCLILSKDRWVKEYALFFQKSDGKGNQNLYSTKASMAS